VRPGPPVLLAPKPPKKLVKAVEASVRKARESRTHLERCIVSAPSHPDVKFSLSARISSRVNNCKQANLLGIKASPSTRSICLAQVFPQRCVVCGENNKPRIPCPSPPQKAPGDRAEFVAAPIAALADADLHLGSRRRRRSARRNRHRARHDRAAEVLPTLAQRSRRRGRPPRHPNSGIFIFENSQANTVAQNNGLPRPPPAAVAVSPLSFSPASSG